MGMNGMGYGASPIEEMAKEAMIAGLCNLDEFTYSAVFSSAKSSQLTANSTIEVQININSDADFIIQQRNMIAFDATPALVADPNILITVVRAGSGRNVMNQAQHVLNYFGNFSSNKVPAMVPLPTLLPASQILTVRLQNLTATNFNDVEVAFIGFKVFYIQSPAGQVGTRQSIFNMM